MTRSDSTNLFFIYSAAFLLTAGLFFAASYAYASEVTIDSTPRIYAQGHNGSTPTVVFTSDSTGYVFYRDSNGSCVYSKTADGGSTWGSAVTIDSQADCNKIGAWYDRWTPGDDTGSYIHIVTMDAADLWYARLDTAGDSLTTPVNASNTSQGGVFTETENNPAITKSTTGAVYMGVQDTYDSFVIKCGASCSTASSWSEAGTNPFDLATDHLILMPLGSGNVLVIRWDISANTIGSKTYDASGNSWDASWTIIDASAADNTTYRAAFGATVNKNNGEIYLAYVADAATIGTDDDIRTSLYSNGAWSAKTDVLNDDTKGITGAKIARDETNDDIYVVYSARTVVTTSSTGNVYYKKSTNQMVSWGEETQVNTTAADIYGARVNTADGERIYAMWFVSAAQDLLGTTVVDITEEIPLPESSTTTPSSAVSGGAGGGVAPTRVVLSGQAYPQGKVELSQENLIPYNQTIPHVVSQYTADGRFNFEYTALLQGSYLFSLRAEDRDGVKSTLLQFGADLLAFNQFVAEHLLLPPTIGVEKRRVARRQEVRITGYATPGNWVELKMNDASGWDLRPDPITGWYAFTASTTDYHAGDYYVRARQRAPDGSVSGYSLWIHFRVLAPYRLSADLNKDKKIDIVDWSIFLSRWGLRDASVRATIDLNGDGKVDVTDFGIFLGIGET